MCSATDMPSPSSIAQTQAVHPPSSTARTQEAPDAPVLEAALQALENALQPLSSPSADSKASCRSVLHSLKDASSAAARVVSASSTCSSGPPLSIRHQQRLLSVIRRVVSAVQQPHSSMFVQSQGSDLELDLLSATPRSAIAQLSADGRAALQAVAHGLHTLTLLTPSTMLGVHVPRLSSINADQSHLPHASEPVSAHAAGPPLPPLLPSPTSTSRTLHLRGKPRPVIIEVLDSRESAATSVSDTETGAPSPQHTIHQLQAEVQEARHSLLIDLVGLVATWWADADLPSPWAVPLEPVTASGKTSSQVDGTQQQEVVLDLTGAGSEDSAIPDAISPDGSPAGALLAALVQAAGSRGSSVSGSGDHAASAVRHKLLAHAGLQLLPAYRQVVLGGTAGWTRQHGMQDVFVAHTPTSTQDRVVAGRRAACLIRLADHQTAVAGLLSVALPAALTVAQDGSPAVAVHGMWALRHLAEVGAPADLRVQGDLLLASARQFIVGCQDTVWAHSCQAAVGLTCAVLGPKDMRAAGYHGLMCDLLNEMERHGTKQSRRLGFLAPEVLPRLLHHLVLTALLHTSRLLPLLLEWLQSYDVESRAAAVQAVYVLLTCIWPRAPAHSEVVWHHVSTLFVREVAADAQVAGQLRVLSEEHLGGDAEVCQGGLQDASLPGPPREREPGTDSFTDLMQACVGVSEAAAWAVRVVELLTACGGTAFQHVLTHTQHQLDVGQSGSGGTQSLPQEGIQTVADFARNGNPAVRGALRLLLAHARTHVPNAA